MTKKYQPSNGTEGDAFIETWCGTCQRDRSMAEGIDMLQCADDELCEILERTFFFNISDPDYPEEWTYNEDDGRPCCTAWIPKGEKIPTPRCPMTKDMFGS